MKAYAEEGKYKWTRSYAQELEERAAKMQERANEAKAHAEHVLAVVVERESGRDAARLKAKAFRLQFQLLTDAKLQEQLNKTNAAIVAANGTQTQSA